MLNQGLSDIEVRDQLQSRVPEFSISPAPGGQWNWLLGLLALFVASTTLLLLARHAVSRRPSDSPREVDFDEEQHWQDRLDDELIDSIE